MIVRRGEVELAVEVHGPVAAPVVLLVHGYPDTRAVWSEIVPRLEGAHRVIMYDVRGAGASTRPGDEAAYDLRELADDAAAVIDACELIARQRPRFPVPVPFIVNASTTTRRRSVRC